MQEAEEAEVQGTMPNMPAPQQLNMLLTAKVLTQRQIKVRTRQPRLPSSPVFSWL